MTQKLINWTQNLILILLFDQTESYDPVDLSKNTNRFLIVGVQIKCDFNYQCLVGKYKVLFGFFFSGGSLKCNQSDFQLHNYPW